MFLHSWPPSSSACIIHFSLVLTFLLYYTPDNGMQIPPNICSRCSLLCTTAALRKNVMSLYIWASSRCCHQKITMFTLNMFKISNSQLPNMCSKTPPYAKCSHLVTVNIWQTHCYNGASSYYVCGQASKNIADVPQDNQ